MIEVEVICDWCGHTFEAITPEPYEDTYYCPFCSHETHANGYNVTIKSSFSHWVVSVINNFNYMLVLGLSGMGKTTFVKHLLNSLKDFKKYIVDPNYQYSDIEEAEFIGAEDLFNALNTIAKPLLFRGQRGILVIEDFGFTIQQLAYAKNKPISKVKHVIKLILENARKYRLKVVIVAHQLKSEEIEPYMLPFFDTVVFFKTPITNYAKRILKYYGVVVDTYNLNPYEYYIYNIHTKELMRGKVSKLESHELVEKSGDFQIRRLLSMVKTKTQAVAVLKLHLNLSDEEIARILGISVNHVRVYKTRLRKYGIKIPLENKNNIREIINLAL